LGLYPRIVTPAGALPVTKDEAKQFCRIDLSASEDDAEIDAFLQTAFQYLQPPFGCLRLSIAEQTLRTDLPCWPGCSLELPAGPVQSIASVKYFDAANVEQTLAAENYFLDNDTLMWAETFAAPAVYARQSAVRISYVTGYDAEAADFPAVIKTAILQCVKHWYDNRDAVQAVGAMNMMPLGFDDLIGAYRVR
jgi:uncharacterized phiE125 gp8 family phage protein